MEHKGEDKTCMAACIDQTFAVSVSSNKFPGEESYNHRSDFCIIVRLGLGLELGSHHVNFPFLESSMH